MRGKRGGRRGGCDCEMTAPRLACSRAAQLADFRFGQIREPGDGGVVHTGLAEQLASKFQAGFVLAM